MAVISIGLVNSSAGITPEHIGSVIGIAFSVNLTWGIIDGVTAMYTYIMERADRDRIVDDLAGGFDPAAAKARGREALDDTIAAALSDAEKDRILDAIARSAPPAAGSRTRRYRANRDDWLFALGIVAIDVGLVVPVVLPLVLVTDIAAGVYVSRLVASVLFAAIGWGYARKLNRNPWLAASFLGLLGFALFTYAYETGG
jgi:NAD/NADP transhydrogenase beta subunit